MCYKLIDEIGLEKFMAKVQDMISSGWILIEGQYSTYIKIVELGEENYRIEEIHYTQMFKKTK